MEDAHLENFKSGNIQNTNKSLALAFGVELAIDHLHQSAEAAFVQTFSQGIQTVLYLFCGSGLVYPFSAGLHSWLQQAFCKGIDRYSQNMADALGLGHVGEPSILAPAPLRNDIEIANVQHGSNGPQNGYLLALREAHDVEGLHQGSELVQVVHPRDRVVAILCVVPAFRAAFAEQEHLAHLTAGAAEELVEDMVVPFVAVLPHHPALFEEIPIDKGTRNLARPSEFDAYELSESRRVVVAKGLGVPKGFEDGIRLEDLILEGSELFGGAVVDGHGRKVLYNLFGVLGFSRTGLSAVCTLAFHRQLAELGETDVTKMLWFSLSSSIFRNARSVTANM